MKNLITLLKFLEGKENLSSSENDLLQYLKDYFKKELRLKQDYIKRIKLGAYSDLLNITFLKKWFEIDDLNKLIKEALNSDKRGLTSILSIVSEIGVDTDDSLQINPEELPSNLRELISKNQSLARNNNNKLLSPNKINSFSYTQTLKWRKDSFFEANKEKIMKLIDYKDFNLISFLILKFKNQFIEALPENLSVPKEELVLRSLVHYYRGETKEYNRVIESISSKIKPKKQ